MNYGLISNKAIEAYSRLKKQLPAQVINDIDNDNQKLMEAQYYIKREIGEKINELHRSGEKPNVGLTNFEGRGLPQGTYLIVSAIMLRFATKDVANPDENTPKTVKFDNDIAKIDSAIAAGEYAIHTGGKTEKDSQKIREFLRSGDSDTFPLVLGRPFLIKPEDQIQQLVRVAENADLDTAADKKHFVEATLLGMEIASR